MGVLSDCLLGGTTVTVRTDIDDLPADVDRAEGTFSIKFRPSAGDGDLLGLGTETPLLLPLWFTLLNPNEAETGFGGAGNRNPRSSSSSSSSAVCDDAIT